MIRPTKKFLYLFLLAFGAALAPSFLSAEYWILWLIVLGGLVLVFLWDLTTLPVAGDFELKFVLPDQLYIGEGGSFDVEISCPSLRQDLSLTMLCDLSDDLQVAAELSGTIAQGQTLSGRFELMPRRRGTQVVERFWWRWESMLGFLCRQALVDLDRDVLVVPNLRFVGEAALKFATRPEFMAGLKTERFLGDGSEFDRLREFMPGMDSRAIDWRATARHRKILARQYRAERNHQVVVSLDCSHLMAEPLTGMPRLDHAVNAGLLLSWCCLKAGDRVAIHAFDDKIQRYTEAPGGVRSMPLVQRAMAAIDYGQGEANYTLAMADLSQRLRRRSLVVILTEFADAITAEIMVENLIRLASRHLVLFVALRDRELDDFVATEPVTMTALGRSVVAHGLHQERERVILRLQRQGILCLNVSPEKLSTELVNTYLQVKSREQL